MDEPENLNQNYDYLSKQNFENICHCYCNNEEFDNQIIYKKQEYNTNADVLSRIQINALEIV